MESVVVGGKDGGAAVDPFWEEARGIFYRGLGQNQNQTPKVDDTTRLEDTIKTLELTRSKTSNEYRTHTLHVGSKDIDIKLGRIMRRLELILQVGDAATRFGPETVSLVWSAFRMVFTGFLKDSKVCASLFDDVDQISDILFVCQIYVKRYSRDIVVAEGSEATVHRVLKQISPLYATVLKFSYQTRKLVGDHGKLGRTLIGVFGGEYEELKVTVDDAKQKRDALQRTAGIAFETTALGILENHSNVLGDVHEAINAVMIPTLRNIQDELVKDREHKELKDLKKTHQEQQAWLLAGTSAELRAPEVHNRANLDHRHPGTCKWILKTPNYKTWRDQKTPSLFYLSGEGGYGKSYLVSTIIEDLQICSPPQFDSEPQVIYFFCKSGDNATQYGMKIMLHLVVQLLAACVVEANDGDDKLSDDKMKYQRVINVIKSAKERIKVPEGKKDSSLLQINSVLQPMFVDLAEVINTRLFVIVDALDECCDFNDGFLDALKALPESGIDIRVLISSRPDDQIGSALSEVCYLEIEVNKKTNHADILAYVDESLKSMQRFRQWKAGPMIVKKSDGMFKYANMVIESLKQSKAVMTNPQQLMKRLPDGMNNLYKQKLQGLQEFDREILLIALRWLMCSEGIIETELVADDIEHCFEDLDPYEADLGPEDNEDSDTDTAVATVVELSPGIEAQERVAEYDDRDSIKRLKEVGRDFVKFSSTVVDIQHKSVRDFINSEEMSQPRDPRICSECAKRINHESAYQASPKNGHLIMVERIFEKLMSASFRDKFIMIGSFDQTKADAGLSDCVDYNSIGEDTPRYELAQWPRHLRAAEEAWPEAERDTDMQSRWNKLYNSVETFLSPESLVYKCWSRRLSLWRQEPLDPLHIAARFGLLGLMQRYISCSTNVDVLDEDRWTSLHYACDKYGENIGVHLLVQHGANVNALTSIGQTPLIILCAGSPSPSLAQYLLDHGAQPEVPDEDGWTCIHYCAGNRNLELCRILLGRSTVNINAKDKEGDTPLHWMFRSPNASSDLVKLFLDHGADVNEQNKLSQGPLYAASLVGNVPAVRLLLEYNADINDDEEVFGRTALHAAVGVSNLDLVKILVERGADVYHQDKKGMDCLALAADMNQLEIVQHLLDTWRGQDAVTAHLMTKDLDGDTPLHRSALRGNANVVDCLLRAGDAAEMCSERNNNDAIPLNSAFIGWKCDYEGADFEKLIVQLAPLSPDVAQNADNLDFAIEKGAIEFIRLLDKPQNSIDIHGWTPVMLAENCGQQETAKALLQKAQSSTTEDPNPERRAAFVRSPSRWAPTTTQTSLVVSEDGIEVAYPSDPETHPPYRRASTRTDHPVRAGLSKYYFEITVLEATSDLPILGLGFSSKYAEMQGNMPGWPGNGAPSWGYHADDGCKFSNSGIYEIYSEGYGPGDIVGCGVNITDGTIFYTKNGRLLPTAFEGVRGRLFPTVGMAPGEGIKIRANFGQQKDMPFRYQSQ